jgi:rare lipoprotein A (peptidoglycan hydrolase)
MMDLLPIVLVFLAGLTSPGVAEPEQMVRRGAHWLLAPIEEEIRQAERAGRFEARASVEMDHDPVGEVETYVASETGEGTYYGGRFHGRRTASGEVFDQTALTAAHPTFPFGTRVRVTNLRNGRSVVVRINDRGPFGPAKVAPRKVIDVSYAAARELGFLRDGRVLVRVDVLE